MKQENVHKLWDISDKCRETERPTALLALKKSKTKKQKVYDETRKGSPTLRGISNKSQEVDRISNGSTDGLGKKFTNLKKALQNPHFC